MAQSGSAPALGAGGREFKSPHPDQFFWFCLMAGSHSGSQTRFSMFMPLRHAQSIQFQDLVKGAGVKHIPVYGFGHSCT